jgi:hypothetical protein
MTTRVLVSLTICACAASALANPLHGQTGDTARAPTVFAARVRDYVTLLQSLKGPRAEQAPTSEANQITDRQDAIADRIAAARRSARQGDIFTADVARYFQTIIRDAFRGPDGKNMRRTILEGDPEPATDLRVNVAYPEDIPLGTMPPMLLRRLPALPEELAYRVVGRALVLKDVTTNLIVDFLPDALPRVR